MRISTTDEKRIAAFVARDAASYSKLCDELGIEPEDSELYELGEMEISNVEQRLSELERLTSAPENLRKKRTKKSKVNPLTYLEFYRNGIKLGKNIRENGDRKRDLLVLYFPRQFGDGGKEPLKDKNLVYVGAKFNHLMESAEKYA